MDDVMTELTGPEQAPHSGKQAQQLVILLHGYGSDGADLISLAPAFADILPHAHFIAPNAPFNCEMSPFGYQWFSLMQYDPGSFEMPSFDPKDMWKKANDAAPILNHFIESQLERFKLKDCQLALVGFSQGTMMALHVSLRRALPCAGVLGYSGALLDANPSPKNILSRPPVCLIHGVVDPVVPFMAMEHAKRGLESVDIPLETHARPMLAHGIDPQGIEIGKTFLQKIFV